MPLNHLSKHIEIIGKDYPGSVLSYVVLVSLVACALISCAVLLLSLWHIRQLH